MAIPERVIDELVARCDISDVVGDYVALTRKGANLWGLCPFHSEKTASFSVSPDKQIYHCFGCGKGGGVISFIMESENLPFPEAVRLLARKAGMELPEGEESGDYRRRRDRLHALNREAARLFHQNLKDPEGEAARDYLKGRGLSQGVVTRFGLGYAPEGWDRLITALGALGYEKAELLTAGLAVKNQNGRIYDRFRGRLMFPIIDLRGQVIGFGGRVMGEGEPKYLNSPETPVFSKGRNLFAMNLARKSKLGRIILTEGYMDTISLHQAGFDCAVASLGTALTPEHAQLLARYTKEVVIAYDGDGAGMAAAQRAIPLLERTGVEVRVLRMAGAKDPDEYLKKHGRESFARLLDRSENHVEYRLGVLLAKYQMDDPVQRVEYSKQAADLIAALPGPVEREVYGARAAELAGISAEAMAQEVTRARERRLRQAKRKKERQDLTPTTQLQPKARALRYTDVKSARAEEGVLRLILLDPPMLRQTGALAPEQFSSDFLGRVFALLRARWQEGRPVSLAALESELTVEESGLLTEILDRPQVLEHKGEAMADYIAVIELQAATRAGGQGQDPLLAVRDKHREKKRYGG